MQDVVQRSVTDFYDLESTLTEEQRLVKETIKRWVGANYLPHINEWATKASFPTHLIPEIAKLGVLGANLPTKYECAGVDSLTYGLIMQELERGDSGLRSFASVQSSLVMYPIFAFGTEEQRKKWLPAMAKGEKVGCFGLTEPQGGSNPANMLTKAKQDGDRWILSGSKVWITNGSLADVSLVWAQTGTSHRDIRGFLVESDRDGFTSAEIKNKVGLKASVTSNLYLSDVRLPKENLLPGTSIGVKAALLSLDAARFGIAFGAIGAAMACFEEALNFANGRAPFGKPLSSYQITQAKLADMLTKITLGQLLCFRLAQLKESGKIKPEQISMAKRSNVRMALEIAREARGILGASGITYDYASGRHEANLVSVDTYEGTYDIHTLILGNAITGKNAF